MSTIYEGQEQRDVLPALNSGIPILPTQPGLSITPVTAPHNGRIYIIDSYASFNLGPKWSTALEGDYVINRVAFNPAPTRVYGGVGYLHRQLTDSLALNGRFAYLKDNDGLFGGITQDLKDVTLTTVYQPVDGFQTRLEYRRDFTNQPFFLTNNSCHSGEKAGNRHAGPDLVVWW